MSAPTDSLSPAGERVGERGRTPELGVCIRDADGAVQFQNGTCRAVCGAQLGVRCGAPCAVEKVQSAGTLISDQGRQLHGVRCDLWLHQSGEEAVTLILRRDALEREVEQLLSEHRLTSRERQVAAAAALGRTNRQIARELGVTVATVRTHLNRAYQKLPPGSFVRKTA